MGLAENMSQSDVVVHGIKDMIVRGELKPSDQLPVEKDLAELLNVSRGSLREGVRALSVLGILDTRQGSGTYVTNLDPGVLLAPLRFVVDLQHADDAVALHIARRVLETEAAGEAAVLATAQQIDDMSSVLDLFEAQLSLPGPNHEQILELDIEFHQLVAAASRNPVVEALISALSSRTVRGRLLRATSDDRAEWATLAEHRAIAAAISDRAPQRSRVRMANHLLVVEDFLRSSTQRADHASDGNP